MCSKGMLEFSWKDAMGCVFLNQVCVYMLTWKGLRGYVSSPEGTPPKNMTIEKQPFEDVSSIKKMVMFHCHLSLVGGFNPSQKY